MSLATSHDTVPSICWQGELTRTEGVLIDISSREAQKAFFRASFEVWGNCVRDNHGYLKRAIVNGEALIMLRGRVSIDLMEVVDPDSRQ